VSAGLYILALAFSFWQPFFFRTPCDGWRNDRVRDESQPQCHWMTNPMLFRFKPNAFGRQTQCFWTSNPMLLDVKPNAFGRQTQRCWNMMAACFRNMLCLIELTSVSSFSAERFRVDASFSMLEQNKKSKETSAVSSLSHEW